MRKGLASLFMAALVWGGLLLGHGAAQDTSPTLQVSLALNSATYVLAPEPGASDPITITLSLANTGTEAIFTKAGFSNGPFHLFLTFIDPDGKGIIATQLTSPSSPEGPPPRVAVIQGELVQVDKIETLPVQFVLTMRFDARTFYAFTKAGSYTVKATIPIRTYPASAVFQSGGEALAPLSEANFQGSLESNTERFVLVADADADGFAFPVADSRVAPGTVPDCDDTKAAVNPGTTEIAGNGIDDDCNPNTPDVVVIAPGIIRVTAQKHTVGSGTQPGSTKAPIVGLTVRAYEKTASPCFDTFGVSWQNYSSIWESNICAVPPAPFVGLRQTDSSGTVTLSVPPGNYLVIGKCGLDCHGDLNNPGALYIGVSAGAVASGGTVQKFLQVISKANGRTVPATTIQKTGSELLIIEPEYVEWNSTKELYPFIFETIGSWSVTTSVTPPEGFVADQKSLSTEVNTTRKAVQFTLTDVGSKWVSTKVEFKIKHKGKSETVLSEVGVKLSASLAKAKGLSRFGDAGPPPLLKKVEQTP